MTVEEMSARLSARARQFNCETCFDQPPPLFFPSPDGSGEYIEARSCPVCAPSAAAKCTTCYDLRWIGPPSAFRGPWKRRCPDCNCATLRGLPAAFARVRLTDVRPLPGHVAAHKAAAAFATSGRNLALIGPVGVGKTMLAAAIGNAMCERADRPVGWFKRWPQTIVQLQGKGDDALFDVLCTTPLLVMDDVGAEQSSDFTRRTATTIYEARNDGGLRTIITSNLTLAQMADHYQDERLSSRIAGSADVVLVAGDDQRLKGRS